MVNEERPNSLIGDLSGYISQSASQVIENLLAASQRILATFRTPGIQDVKREVERIINRKKEQRNQCSPLKPQTLARLQANIEGMEEVARVLTSLPEEAQEQIDLYIARRK